MKETLFLTTNGSTFAKASADRHESLTPSSRFAGLRRTSRYRCAGNLNFGEEVGGVLYPDFICSVSPMSGCKTPPTFQTILGEGRG